jgi:hypothetical protein
MTADTITDTEIEQLLAELDAEGHHEEYAKCIIALHDQPTPPMDVQAARKRCAELIVARKKQFTVVFAQKLPFNQGVAAFHCSVELANSAEEAAQSCVNSLGGYGFVVTVFAGSIVPVLRGIQTMVWDSKAVRYKDRELDIPKFYIKS